MTVTFKYDKPVAKCVDICQLTVPLSNLLTTRLSMLAANVNVTPEMSQFYKKICFIKAAPINIIILKIQLNSIIYLKFQKQQLLHQQQHTQHTQHHTQQSQHQHHTHQLLLVCHLKINLVKIMNSVPLYYSYSRKKS